MIDLKPCPFCGGTPERVYKSSGQTTHIECTSCKAQFPKSTMSNRYDEAWNTRAEPMKEVIHCEDCENAHFFYPWRYPGERSTVEVGTCALMAEGVTIERDGYCAFAERREA